jgi:hypothetical protein
MSGRAIHYASTYHRPSWQGGDVRRGICQTGIAGFFPHRTTTDPLGATCRRCVAKLGGKLKPVRRKAEVVILYPPVVIERSMHRIAAHVSLAHGVDLAELIGPARDKPASVARHEAMWMMSAAGYSKSAIGRFFSRDHATVIHGIRQHSKRLAEAQGRAA